MRSAFFEFHVAKTGLFTSRGGLEVTNHNIANAATDGFSRQYVETRANWPLTYNNSKGMVGTGSEIYGIGQMRDFYLDTKYWAEEAVLGEYSTKQTQLSIIEKNLAELTGTGTTSGFNLFFDTLQDLSTTAGDDTYRINVLQAAQGLSTFVNNTTQLIKKQQRDINEEVNTVVQSINSLGQQIRSLNEQIILFEMGGSKANDLRDSRARIVDELSKYVNVEVLEVERSQDYARGVYPEPEDRGRSHKEFYVNINGMEFVSHRTIRPLRVEERTEKLNAMDVPGLYDIYFEGSNTKLNIFSPDMQGELKGLIDVRDGNNSGHLEGVATTVVGNDIIIKNPTKLDINDTGFIEVTNSTTGQKETLRYKAFIYNDITKEMTLAIDTAYKPMVTFAVDGATVGKTIGYKGIPHYLDKFNKLVRTFSKAINEGKDRNGNEIPGVVGHEYGFDANDNNTGIPFFTYKDITMPFIENDEHRVDNYNKMNCENFIVNPNLFKNTSLMASEEQQGQGLSENKVILGFVTLSQYKGLFAEGKLNDYIIGISGELGVDVNQATKFNKNYTDVTTSINNQRLSVSGVDLNEEMVNMIKYQQIYQASSKLINIIDGIYDTTVNKLGLT